MAGGWSIWPVQVPPMINGTVTEKYLWSGKTTLLAVYDGVDNLLQRFEYADDRMPYAMTSGGITYYLAYDQVGTLRLVTDSSGAIIKRIDYDSFGNIIIDTNPTFTIPFGFAGGLHDRDTGLVRFGYRDYLPGIGKWTAKDPIDFAAGDSNLYGYVLNDPVNFVDPLGLLSWGDVGGVTIAAGFGMLGLSATVTAPAWVPVVGAGLVVGGIGLTVYDFVSSIYWGKEAVENIITDPLDSMWKEVDQMNEENSSGSCIE